MSHEEVSSACYSRVTLICIVHVGEYPLPALPASFPLHVLVIGGRLSVLARLSYPGSRTDVLRGSWPVTR